MPEDDAAATSELLAAARDAAARNIDYYALLDLLPPATADTPLPRDVVQRAWRKRSLKYHPDKAGAQFDKQQWEEFGLARDILGSEAARAVYDSARNAAVAKQREREAMSAKQRMFAEELERAEGGSRGVRRQTEEAREREVRLQEERGRQAAAGRAVMEERRRKVAEAEERERLRAQKEDEQRDDRIRELEERIADKARRRAEKKAKREGRKSGVTVADDDDDKNKKKASPVPAPAPATATAPAPATPIPALDVQMSEDPVKFWETQWPKTKARLLAAQATKQQRIQQTRAAAA